MAKNKNDKKNDKKNDNKNNGKNDNKNNGKKDGGIGNLDASGNKTSWGRNLEAYGEKNLERANRATAAAINAGYIDPSKFTKAYYEGVTNLGRYGDKENQQALNRTADLYGDYRKAGDYNKTGFKAFEEKYGKAGKYDTGEFEKADYTAQNIKERMSPYEKLVAERNRARLKRTYDEARGEREAQAARAGAFGGSGAAIQEELARRNYAEQLKDLDAQSLQAAFESGAGLYSKEIADRLAAQQAEEQSRQFGKEAQFKGIEGAMGARQQTAAQEAAAWEAKMKSLAGQQSAAAQQSDIAERQKNMQIANLNAAQGAGQQEEAFNLGARTYGLDIAQRQANIANALQGAPQPASRQEGPSDFQKGLGYLAAGAGVASNLGIFRSGGVVMVRDRRYNGGGLADLEPQYYSMYER